MAKKNRIRFQGFAITDTGVRLILPPQDKEESITEMAKPYLLRGLTVYVTYDGKITQTLTPA
jgi:hypothetical protein